MPGQTALFDLPYPVGSDPADGPDGYQDLANQLELVLTQSDLIWTTGDFKSSARTSDHGLWLLCDGRELTAAEVCTALSLPAGSADDLATLLGTGASSIYGTAAVGKIQLPDPRGRLLMPIGAGPGLTARTLGQTGGVESVTLSSAQSGVASHSHGINDAQHAHSMEAHHHRVYWDRWNDLQGGGTREAVKEIKDGVSELPADRNDRTGALDAAADTGVEATGVTTNPSSAVPAAQSHDNMPPWLALGRVFIRV